MKYSPDEEEDILNKFKRL